MKKTSTKPATETPSSKPLDKTIKFITILFRSTCPKLTARGKGDLSYELGIDEDTADSYVRISGNDSSGAYILGKRGIQESALALKEVTFGLRCSVALMHTVIAALKAREEEVSFYRMYEVRGSFKLKRRCFDIDEMQAFLPHTAKSGEEIFGSIIKDQ